MMYNIVSIDEFHGTLLWHIGLLYVFFIYKKYKIVFTGEQSRLHLRFCGFILY